MFFHTLLSALVFLIVRCDASLSPLQYFFLAASQVMTTFMPPPPAATFLAFHPQDNNIIAIGMEDSTIQIYNVRVDEVGFTSNSFPPLQVFCKITFCLLFVNNTDECKEYRVNVVCCSTLKVFSSLSWSCPAFLRFSCRFLVAFYVLGYYSYLPSFV